MNYDEKGQPRGNYVAEKVNQALPHTASRSVDEMLELLEDGQEGDRHEY